MNKKTCNERRRIAVLNVKEATELLSRAAIDLEGAKWMFPKGSPGFMDMEMAAAAVRDAARFAQRANEAAENTVEA